MAFKATKYFVLIAVLVIAGTRYMNVNMDRINMNNEVGIWDTKAKDGLRYTIVTRSNETRGEFFVAHAYCTPQAQGFYPGKPCSPPLHTHDTQDEEFEAVSGVLMLNWNGTEVHLPVGEKRTVPAGLPHTFWNGGSEPLEVLIKWTPGAPDEGFLEMAAALAREFGGLGRVNPMQLVLLFAEHGMTLTEVPEPLWLAAKKFLVPLARLIGLRSHYPAYVSKSGQPLPVEASVEEAAVAPAVEPVEEAVVEPVEEAVVEPVEEAVVEAAEPAPAPEAAELAPVVEEAVDAAEDGNAKTEL